MKIPVKRVEFETAVEWLKFCGQAKIVFGAQINAFHSIDDTNSPGAITDEIMYKAMNHCEESFSRL